MKQKVNLEKAVILMSFRLNVALIQFGEEFRHNEAGADDAQGVGKEVEDVAATTTASTIFLKNLDETGHEYREDKVAEEMFYIESVVCSPV